MAIPFFSLNEVLGLTVPSGRALAGDALMFAEFERDIMLPLEQLRGHFR